MSSVRLFAAKSAPMASACSHFSSRARGGEHRGARVLRELDRGDAHTRAGGVDHARSRPTASPPVSNSACHAVRPQSGTSRRARAGRAPARGARASPAPGTAPRSRRGRCRRSRRGCRRSRPCPRSASRRAPRRATGRPPRARPPSTRAPRLPIGDDLAREVHAGDVRQREAGQREPAVALHDVEPVERASPRRATTTSFVPGSGSATSVSSSTSGPPGRWYSIAFTVTVPRYPARRAAEQTVDDLLLRSRTHRRAADRPPVASSTRSSPSAYARASARMSSARSGRDAHDAGGVDHDDVAGPHAEAADVDRRRRWPSTDTRPDGPTTASPAGEHRQRPRRPSRADRAPRRRRAPRRHRRAPRPG